MAVVAGKSKWACITNPNTKFEDKYCIDLVVDDETYEAFKSKGYPTKIDDDGDKCIKFQRKVEKKDGSPNKKPALVDRYKKPFDDLIGNGSDIRVQYSPFTWKFGTKSGTGLDLQGVQVINLIEYSRPDGAEFDEVETEEDALDTDFVSVGEGEEDTPFA